MVPRIKAARCNKIKLKEKENNKVVKSLVIPYSNCEQQLIYVNPKTAMVPSNNKH